MHESLNRSLRTIVDVVKKEKNEAHETVLDMNMVLQSSFTRWCNGAIVSMSLSPYSI
jgi:hypothetical protein